MGNSRPLSTFPFLSCVLPSFLAPCFEWSSLAVILTMSFLRSGDAKEHHQQRKPQPQHKAKGSTSEDWSDLLRCIKPRRSHIQGVNAKVSLRDHLYVVNLPRGAGTVRRRFGDVLWLNRALRATFPGITLPVLPPAVGGFLFSNPEEELTARFRSGAREFAWRNYL